MLNQVPRVTKKCNKKASVSSQNQQDNQIRESFGNISKIINIINKITRFLFPSSESPSSTCFLLGGGQFFHVQQLFSS
jgi:hypothetical protein